VTFYSDPRRLKNGWTQMGRVMIPVLPLPAILTDRADGTQWLISWNDTVGPDGVGRIAITDDLTARNRDGAIVYPAYEGPVVLGTVDGQYRLLLRNQHLGIEYRQFQQGEQGYNSPPIYARKKGSTHRRQLVLIAQDATFPASATMAFTVDQDTE
jgi:hypothetical protein